MYKTRSKRIQRIREQEANREIRKTKKAKPKTELNVQGNFVRLRADFFDQVVLAVFFQEDLPPNLPSEIHNEINHFGGPAQWIACCSRKGHLRSNKSIARDSHLSDCDNRRASQRFVNYLEVHLAFLERRLPRVHDWMIRELALCGVKTWLNKYGSKKLRKQVEYQQRKYINS